MLGGVQQGHDVRVEDVGQDEERDERGQGQRQAHLLADPLPAEGDFPLDVVAAHELGRNPWGKYGATRVPDPGNYHLCRKTNSLTTDPAATTSGGSPPD